MDLQNIYSFEELTNEAERLVIEELGQQLEELDDPSIVNDEGTVLDIAAYALNRVPPMYRANLLGRIYADTLRERHEQEIRDAVRAAIEKVTSTG